jgi:NAD(P)-dependent dehydrogenase (short-subunit alcohol dehydrogenase family)
MKRLDGKVAIITGGASGIGEAAVRKFVAEGARVVIADLAEKKGKDLAKSVGESAIFEKTDVSSEDDIRSLINITLERFGRIDCLYNNAGFGTHTRPVAETPTSEFDAMTTVLLRGTFLGIKHAAPIMTKQKSGTIVNTSSVAGIAGGYSSLPYSAAKAGVISLTRSAALELGKAGVRVNCICPGSIVTPIFVRGIPFSEKEERQALEIIAQSLGGNALGRAGTADEVADVALWLAGDESSFVTGQAIVVDGGLTVGLNWSDMTEWMDRLYGTLAKQFPDAFAKLADPPR